MLFSITCLQARSLWPQGNHHASYVLRARTRRQGRRFVPFAPPGLINRRRDPPVVFPVWGAPTPLGDKPLANIAHVVSIYQVCF